MSALRHLEKGRTMQSRELVRLSSGDRIQRAAYDPAGLAISESFRSEIRVLGQAHRNANDGISLLQNAEGGLNSIGNMAIRLKQLAVQASTDTIGNRERQFVNLEFKNLTEEIKRITKVTDFNGIKTLEGGSRKYGIQLGAGSEPKSNRLNYDLKRILKSSDELPLLSSSVKNAGDARKTLEKIDSFINEVGRGKSYLGGMQNRLTSAAKSLSIMREGTEETRSKIRDADIAKSSTEKVKSDVISEASRAMLAQASNFPKKIEKLVS